MDNNLSVKHLTFRDGERHKLLVDSSSGVPLFYPSLYVTSHIRGNSHSVSTIQSFISALKVMYSWLEYYGINIESRLKQAQLLTLPEIISLRDFTKKRLTNTVSEATVIPIGRKNSGLMNAAQQNQWVKIDTQYNRMTVIADYLQFLSELLCKSNKGIDSAKNIEKMCQHIKSHRPKKRGRNQVDRDDKGLDLQLVEDVIKVLQPGHIKNPFKDKQVQTRNALIISLLRVLGIRRSELLNIRVDDINFTTNEVSIIRHHDSKKDPRTHQPNPKSNERTLPISELLAKEISDYVLNIRSQFSLARRHPYLFVTHKSGPSQGAPLSNSGFGKLMATLQSIAKEYNGMHAHAFRHTWNYVFSQALDGSDNNVSPEKEEQMRSYLMGWSPTSGTASTYNKRHIKEKAKEAILEFQSTLRSQDRANNEKK